MYVHRKLWYLCDLAWQYPHLDCMFSLFLVVWFLTCSFLSPYVCVCVCDPCLLPFSEPTVVSVVEDLQPDSIMDNIWTIVAAVGGLIVGMVLGLLLFAAIRNREKFLWWHCLSRRHYDGDSDEKCEDYCIDFTKVPEQNINNAKPLPPRPTTPPLTKLNPTTPLKITDSPVLTKYTSTSRHRRSNSSGGSFNIQPADQACLHLNNVKHTVHVEESVSNSDRQRYGKNMISRQISKDYPMPSKETSVSYRAQTNSLGFTDP